MPFESSRRYLGQRCFHNFGHVLNQPSTTNILCLSVFDINRHNAHLREISRPSKLLLPKMQGLPDFGFLGSLSLEHRPQEVKPGSKHRYDWDIPGDARWPLNPLVGGHLTLKRLTELSQKDSSIWSFNFSGAPAFFHRLSGREKGFASDDYSSCLLTLNLQIECLLKVKTKISTRTIPRIPHMSQSMAWCLKSSHFGWQMLHFWAKLCLSSWRQGMIDLWSCQVRSCMSNSLQIPCAKHPLAMNSFSHYRSSIPLASVFFLEIPDHSMNVSEGQESWLAFQKDAELSQAKMLKLNSEPW